LTNLTSIKIFGKPFEVKFLEDDFESNTLGLCRSVGNSITILEGMTPAEELDTVLHELLHAISHVMSVPFPNQEAEEVVVHMIGTGLAGVFLDNPSLLAYIAQTIKKVQAPRVNKKK
jgi:ABC-type Co2+ transport system permease subunit